jgi:ketosteroid isomerase-like protein
MVLLYNAWQTGDHAAMDDDQRRARNKEVVQWVYTHLEERASQSLDEMRRYLAEGAVMELPYSGLPASSPTFEERLETLKATVERFRSWRQSNFVFHDCLDPDELIWEADAEAEFRYSGAEYPQRYVMFVRMKDFKIVFAKEYYNGLVMHLFQENEDARDSSVGTE